MSIFQFLKNRRFGHRQKGQGLEEYNMCMTDYTYLIWQLLGERIGGREGTF